MGYGNRTNRSCYFNGWRAQLRLLRRSQVTEPVRCPDDGTLMVWEARDHRFSCAGKIRICKCTGWWCNKCGEGILERDELAKAFDIAEELRESSRVTTNE